MRMLSHSGALSLPDTHAFRLCREMGEERRDGAGLSALRNFFRRAFARLKSSPDTQRR